MEIHPLTSAVRSFYNKLNAETNFDCRCNAEQLTEQQKADFASLGEEIKKRYYGSGLIIPENIQGKRILDIGCGSGSLVFMLSKLVGPTGYVVGIDITDGLLQTARDHAEYHWKLWGYDKPNFEFQILNAEALGEADFKSDEFDIIVSNGVLSLIPDKQKVFKAVYKLLKPGGQFFLNDVYAEKDVPEKYKDSEILWAVGITGSMRWDTLSAMAGDAGFTTPYLTSATPDLMPYLTILKEDERQMLERRRYACSGWRLFKLDPQTDSKGPALVTYNGRITDYPDAFPWDVELTFQKGKGVEVDGELATILSSIYLKDCFSIQPTSGHPVTYRNQNPFQLMDKLQIESQLLDIHKTE